MPVLEELQIADEPELWRTLGFDVDGELCRVSTVALRLAGSGPRRGILGWTFAEEAPETPAPETPAPETPPPETPAPETPAPTRRSRGRTRTASSRWTTS